MSLLKSILAPGRREERRRDARQAQDCGVLLFQAGRPAGSARLMDLSAGGARLHGPAELIRGADAFVVASTRKAYFYEVVRTGFGGVGVRIVKSQSLSGRLPQSLEGMRRAIG